MTLKEIIADLKDYKDEPYIHDALSDEVVDTAINALSAIEDIKQEIQEAMGEYYYGEHDLGVRQGFRFALEIIDKHISEKENNE